MEQEGLPVLLAIVAHHKKSHLTITITYNYFDVLDQLTFILYREHSYSLCYNV